MTFKQRTKVLADYKEKISMLSDDEKIKRDLYLKKLSLGELMGPMTGYVSLDKPWLRYHPDSYIMTEFTPMSAYQLMIKCNEGNEDLQMFEYMGTKLSFKETYKKIDLVSKSLLEFGIKQGDMVIIALPNCPEAIYLFYALNKIGAIINSIDPRYSEDNIKESIEETDCKYFFGVSMMLQNIKNVSSDVKVIDVSPYYSLPFPLKQIANLKNKTKYPSGLEVIRWKDFLKIGKESKIREIQPYFKSDEPAIICHTGGSTGTPKGVLYTNEEFNALIYQLINNDVGLNRGNSFLNILPPFVAMGLDDGLHLAACAGINQILIPSVNPEDFSKLIKKYKPNMVLCGSVHCNCMLSAKELDGLDMSFLKIIMYGGGEYPESKQIQFNEFLKDHGADIVLTSGYGATETASGSSCSKKSCYKMCSSGAPYIRMTDAIIDTDTGEEIRGLNRIGELYITGPTLMEGYIGKRADETENVIYTDENGVRWYKTGDLAHFDEDGKLFIDGRIKRIILRRAYKIYPQYVEELFSNCPYIQEVAVVGIPDEEDFCIPVANIVLKTEYKDNTEIQQRVIDFCNDTTVNKISEAANMAGFNFLDELPKTPIGKLDFKKLESIGIISQDNKVVQKKYNLY